MNRPSLLLEAQNDIHHEGNYGKFVTTVSQEKALRPQCGAIFENFIISKKMAKGFYDLAI